MCDNNFWNDNEWQRRKRDKYLVHLYGKYARDGRYVFLDKGRCSSLIQKRLAADTIVQGRRGDSPCVEEKIVRFKGQVLTRFCLETESCTVPGHESPGWMRYGEADLLNYCYEVEKDGPLDCFLSDFQAVKKWFWEQDLSRFYYNRMKKHNRTGSYLVPIIEVAAAVKTVRFLIDENGKITKLDPLQTRTQFITVAAE